MRRFVLFIILLLLLLAACDKDKAGERKIGTKLVFFTEPTADLDVPEVEFKDTFGNCKYDSDCQPYCANGYAVQPWCNGRTNKCEKGFDEYCPGQKNTIGGKDYSNVCSGGRCVIKEEAEKSRKEEAKKAAGAIPKESEMAFNNCLCQCKEPRGGQFSCAYNEEALGHSPSCRDLSNGPCICVAFGCFRTQPVESGECYDACVERFVPKKAEGEVPDSCTSSEQCPTYCSGETLIETYCDTSTNTCQPDKETQCSTIAETRGGVTVYKTCRENQCALGKIDDFRTIRSRSQLRLRELTNEREALFSRYELIGESEEYYQSIDEQVYEKDKEILKEERVLKALTVMFYGGWDEVLEMGKTHKNIAKVYEKYKYAP
ncbi:MAG: hypothetical protein ACE5FT_02560 [Candidatus Nanoarchaeia archaeon]